MGRKYDLQQHPRALFNEWQKDFPQSVDGPHERQLYANFIYNLQRIKDLNNDHNGQATFGLNEFSAMSPAEFKSQRAGGIKQRTWNEAFNPVDFDTLPIVGEAELAGIPTSVDWRTRSPPVVTPVKNQGKCGDCWAFSTTGNVEGQWALSGRPLVSLSEQQLCDCDTTDQGCNGGLMQNAMQYIIRTGGLDTEAAYPYTAKQGSCKFKASGVAAKINSFKMIPHDPQQIAYYVANQGPVAIAVDATTWQTYTGGIVKSNCGKDLDHGVLLVGYGQSGNTPYWIVKNSWGTGWGMKGFILVSRGPGDECGIDKNPVTAIVNRTRAV